MTQWYYRRHGREHGPFTPKQFKELAATGKIQPSDEIRKDGMPAFVPGTRIEGLFPRTPVAPLEAEPDEGYAMPVHASSRTGRRIILLAAALGLVSAAAGAWWFWHPKEEPPEHAPENPASPPLSPFAPRK